MDILISVIVPVYNVEQYLERCIQSIINQTYDHLEILLVNDGSTDRSGAICDNFEQKDKRIKVFHIENGGSSIARNHGLRESKGDYIGFVDSDDWIRPEMYEELLNFAITNNLKVVEIGSKNMHLADSQNLNDTSVNATIEDKATALKRIIKHKRFAVWRRLYHHSIVKDRFFIEGILHQDVYYTLDIINEIPQLGYIENAYYIYNVQNPKSVIRSNYSLIKLKSIRAASYVVEHTQQYSKEIQDLAKHYLFDFLSYHYDALYLNSYLDKEGKYRRNIRETIKQNYSHKNFHFYGYAIILLPPLFYKLFLITNKNRIKIQSKIYQIIKNV